MAKQTTFGIGFLLAVLLSALFPAASEGAWTSVRKDSFNSGSCYDIQCEFIPSTTLSETVWNYVESAKPLVFSNDEAVLYVDTGSDSNPLQALNAETGDLLWTVTPVGQNVPGLTYSPTVAPSGTIYLPIYNRLIAVDGTTGEVMWYADIEVGSSPVIDSQERLYFGSSSYFYCLDSTTRTIAWKFFTAEYGQYAPILSSDETTVYFLTNYQSLYSVNTQDGTMNWMFVFTLYTEYDPRIPPILSEQLGLIFIACYSGEVYAIRTSDGERQWTFLSTFTPTYIESTSYLLLGGPNFDILFVISGLELFALQATDGTVLWSKLISQSYFSSSSTPVIGPEGLLYVPLGNYPRTILVLEPTTGDVYASVEREVYSPLIISSDGHLLGQFDGSSVKKVPLCGLPSASTTPTKTSTKTPSLTRSRTKVPSPTSSNSKVPSETPTPTTTRAATISRSAAASQLPSLVQSPSKTPSATRSKSALLASKTRSTSRSKTRSRTRSKLPPSKTRTKSRSRTRTRSKTRSRTRSRAVA